MKFSSWIWNHSVYSGLFHYLYIKIFVQSLVIRWWYTLYDIWRNFGWWWWWVQSSHVIESLIISLVMWFITHCSSLYPVWERISFQIEWCAFISKLINSQQNPIYDNKLKSLTPCPQGYYKWQCLRIWLNL